MPCNSFFFFSPFYRRSKSRIQPHSEVPKKKEDWPQLGTIVQFQSRVRARLLRLYDDILSGRRPLTRKIGRVLYMTLEHEGMHAETLLYMLFQRAGTGTIPPAGFSVPQWSILAKSWDALPPPKSNRVELGPEAVTLGHNDAEADDVSGDVVNHEFGWDNERPQRTVHVGKFAIEWRPITNGQFYEFYMGEKSGCLDFPVSWAMVDDKVQVHRCFLFYFLTLD